MGLRLTILKSEKLKIIFSMLIIFSLLLSTFMLVNAGLFGEKLKKISDNELKEIKVELNLSKDPNFYSYTDSMLKEALDKEINSQETPGLTFGSFILNALYEEKLVEMCYPNFDDKKSSLFFSKLAENLSYWQKNFASKTTKLALQGVIEAYLKMPKLGIGTSTLFLAIDLVQINVAMAKLAKVIARKALFYYLFNRSQGDSHETAWGEGIPPLYDNWRTESFFQSLWNKYGEAILSDNLDNFREEQYEFLRVLILQALNRPPNPPTNMIQFKSDGKTILKIGKTTTKKTVILKAKVSDPDQNKVKLQIELRRLDEYEGKFDEEKGGLQQSDLFENNSEIMIPIYELADGDYHWRARVIDEHGLVSEWISFGGNPDSAVDFTIGQEVVAPIITSPLKITPDPPYHVGDTINAEFTITNKDATSIAFSVLTVGGRDPDSYVSDFTHRQNITLEPSKSYNYQGTLTLNKVGNYHFFCTYQTPDGEWNANVDVGSKLTDGDRVEDIVVTVKKAEKEAVYITDGGNHRIQKFTSEGKFINKWGKEGNGDGEFNYPVGIAVDSQGNVYVADWGNHRIQKFTSEGKFINKWGKEGLGTGNFRDPVGIAIDSQGNVYVADWNNHCIQIFTSEGRLITKWEWDKGGTDGGEFDYPTGIAVDSQDNVYVVNGGNHRILKFTSEGRLITKWGKKGNGDGEFDRPEGIAVDSQDNVYVVNGGNHRILKFTSEGRLITKWGKKGNGDGEFDCPMRIAISRIYGTEELEEKEKEKPSIAPDISEELHIEWDKTFGGSENDWARAIIQTNDGGYTVAGATESKGAGKNDAWIIKLDHQGNKIWDKVYGGGEHDYVFSLIQTNDGGYTVAGATESKGAGKNDAWIIKLDNRGNIEWDKTFGGSESDAAGSIIKNTDGGYVIAGSTSSKGAGNFDAWIIKLDNRGNIEWDKTFGGSESDAAYSLVQTTDGGYVIAGATKSKGAGKNDAWIIKLDNRGNMEWDKTFGGSESDLVYSLIQTNDSGYTIAGYTSSKGAGKNDAWIIKLDNRGNMEWDKTFGGNKYEWIISLIQTNDSGYTIAGYTSSKGAGKNDAWIIKLDHQGNKIWDKVYGEGEHDYVFSLIQTNDSGYTVAGQTESKGAGKTDIWVIKFSSRSIEALKEEVTEVSSSKDYFPLDEGRIWEYQFFLKTGEDWHLGPVSKMSGERILTNFPQRELKGEKVTPQQREDKVRGSNRISFYFYIKDQSGVYEFAHQGLGQVEPKIAYDIIIKYPIKIGNRWQETESSEFEPEISIPVESTIESINEVVTVPAGTFEGCLKIKTVGFVEKDTSGEWRPKETLRIDKECYTWFAPGIGIIKVIFKEEKTLTGIVLPTLPSEFVEFTMQLKTFK